MRRRSAGTGRRAAATAVLLALTGWFIVCCAAGVHAAEGEVTLAVLATEAEMAPLAALVEVRLSQQNVRLVERATLDSVLQEQELSAAGLADRETLVKVGRLLRADAFLLLSLEEKPKKAGEEERPGLLRIRLAETTHGIRLLDWYVPWEPDKVEEAAGAVVQEVGGPAAKLALPAGEIVPVSIVGIHRVLLGEEHQWLCRVLKAMLSSRLSKEPRIVMLEREDLKLLQEEKGLTGGEKGDFWRSGVLVTGELRWSAKEAVELRLRVERPDAEEAVLGPFTFDRAAPLSAVCQAEDGLTEVLGSTSTGPSWQPEHEAERLLREVALLQWHGREAVSLLETALALQPDNVSCALQLFRRVGDHWINTRGLYNAVQKAELAGRLARLARDRFPDGEPMDMETVELQWQLERYILGRASTAPERVAELNRSTRKIIAETLAAYSAASEPVPGVLHASDKAGLAQGLMAASTPEEALANARQYVKRRLFPPSQGGEAQSFAERCEACMGIVAAPRFRFCWPNHLEGDDHAFTRLFVQFCEELASSSDPLVAFTGSILCTMWLPEAEWGPRVHIWVEASDIPGDKQHYADRALTVFDASLCSAEVSPAGAKALRECVMRLLLQHPDSLKGIKRLADYYAPLIERGDVDAILAWGVPGSRPSVAHAKGALPYCHLARLQDGIVGAMRTAPARPDAALALKTAKFARLATCDALRDYLPYLKEWVSRSPRSGTPVYGKSLPELEQELAEIKSVLAAVEPPYSPPPKVTMLVRPKDSPGPMPGPTDRPPTSLSRCRQAGDVLWVAMVTTYTRRDVRVSLMGIDLKARKTRVFWQTVSRNDPRSGASPGLALSPEAIYMLWPAVGLLKFPGPHQEGTAFSEAPTLVGKDGSLPPVAISSVAFRDGKLWLGLGRGEGGLGTYDPETGAWRAIVTRSDEVGSSPSGGEGAISELTSVEQGLLFQSQALNNSLWLMRPGGEELELVCRLPSYSEIVGAPGGPWIQAHDFLGRILLEERRVEVLAGSDDMRTMARDERPHWPIEYTPFLAPPVAPDMPDPLGFLGPHLRAGAVHGDALWAHYGRHKIIILHRGKTIDEADYMRNDILDGKKVLRFVSTPYGLVGIGEGSVGLIEPGP